MAARCPARAFIKTGAGTLAYNGDSSGYTGTTSISSGTLLIGTGSGNANAALGSAVTVQSGATLAGHGALGSGAGTGLTVASGGTVSPGNAGIGTLTVKGNLAFNDGARYSVQTDPTGSGADLIHATGTAALDGGSVAQIGQAGNYGLRSTYKILSADDGLSGTFGSVTSNFAFLDPKLTYDANNAYLTLTRNNISFTSNGLTPNQNAAAGAVDSIGLAANNPLYDAVALLPNDSAAIHRAFDQLSGEIHASAKTALIEDSRYLREAATDRMRAAFGRQRGTRHGGGLWRWRRAAGRAHGRPARGLGAGLRRLGQHQRRRQRRAHDPLDRRLRHGRRCAGGWLAAGRDRRLQPQQLQRQRPFILGHQRQLPSGPVWRHAVAGGQRQARAARRPGLHLA